MMPATSLVAANTTLTASPMKVARRVRLKRSAGTPQLSPRAVVGETTNFFQQSGGGKTRACHILKMALPHLGPLPAGEGEFFAAIVDHLRLDLLAS